MQGWPAAFAFLFWLLVLGVPGQADTGPTHGAFDEEQALEFSQGVIGGRISDQAFTRPDGSRGRLEDLRGKPLILSLVYTSCNHICVTTTRNLASAVEKARDALGTDSFNVMTVGFDTRFDTPERMGQFANLQGIDDPRWTMASLTEQAVGQLARDVGFLFRPFTGGYDHLVQTTIIDADGRVYRQVYGRAFNTPLLVDPLIALILGREDPALGFLADLKDKVRLFCTTYDPVRDGYYFDYSLFVGIAIGAVIILLTGAAMLREARAR